MPAPHVEVQEDDPPPATTQPVTAEPAPAEAEPEPPPDTNQTAPPPRPAPGPEPEVMPPPQPDPFVCFAAGTLILVDGGQVPVEMIRPGARVMTADHGFATVRWVGARVVAGTGALAPVLFEAGALGNARDLRVSPQHRMLVSGARAELLFGVPEVLVPALALVDGRRVRRDPCPLVSYHHLLFDAHEVVFAEGAASESFHPGEMAMGALDEAQRAEVLALFPELAEGAGSYQAARPSLRGWEARALA